MLILASWIFYIPISFRYQVTQRITKLAEFVAILQAHHVSVQQPNNIVENPVFDHLATCTCFKKMTKDSVWKKTTLFWKCRTKIMYIIRMMISKVTPLWFVSFDSFDPETSTNFNPAMLFHRYFSGQRGDESTTIPSWNSRVPTSTPKNWVVGRLLPFWGSA